MVRHTQAFEARARGRVAGWPRPGGGQLQVQPLSPTRLLTRTATGRSLSSSRGLGLQLEQPLPGQSQRAGPLPLRAGRFQNSFH